VFLTRYLDLFTSFVSLYNTFMKIVFIASSSYIIYLMRVQFRSAKLLPNLPQPLFISITRATNDPSIDTFRVEFLVGPAFILALIANYEFALAEILWSFSIWLESVAILPQLFMLQRTGEAEAITTHYLAALGIYRALYIPNWIYRYACSNLNLTMLSHLQGGC
jgi:ER lumen protein retaining receptor